MRKMALALCALLGLAASAATPAVEFTSNAVTVAEGGKAVIAVKGGSTDAATSVKVHLTYGTAAAADLNLGKTKYPITLKWAKGEVGEKRFSVPTKNDAAYEDEETFVLQLASPSGVGLGDARTCIVTITDNDAGVSLNEGIMNGELKVKTSGDGKWTVKRGWGRWDAEDTAGPYHVETPALKKGKSSTLQLYGVAGRGEVSVIFRFTGDMNEAVPSTLKIYADNQLMKTFRHADLGNAWMRHAIDSYGVGSHTYKYVFTQGSDPNCHVELSEVFWNQYWLYEPCIVSAYSSDPRAGRATGSGWHEKGYGAKISAKANPGWTFTGWYTFGENDEPALWNSNAVVAFTANEDINVRAMFKRKPYVRGLADTAAGGKVTGSASVASGGNVTLKAAAAANYHFGGWYAASAEGERDASARVGDKATLVVTNVVSDMTYWAEFILNAKVSVKYNEKCGKVSGAGRYAPGKTAKLQATPKKGYVFSGWYEDGDRLSAKQGYSVEMEEEDRTFEARFISLKAEKSAMALSIGDRPETTASLAPTSTCHGVRVRLPLAASGRTSNSIVSVSGLPKGTSYSKTEKAISGVPALSSYDKKKKKYKPYSVTIKVKSAGGNVKTWVLKWTVLPLPAWAKGTFDGGVFDGTQAIGKSELTIGSSGKVSGKLMAGGLVYTLTASSYDAYLKDGSNECFRAHVICKGGGGTVTNEMRVVKERLDIDGTAFETRGVASAVNAEWRAWQNIWSSANLKGYASVLALLEALYIRGPEQGLLRPDGRSPEYITLEPGASGNVMVRGTFYESTECFACGPDVPSVVRTASSRLIPMGRGCYGLFIYFPENAGNGFAGYSRCILLTTNDHNTSLAIPEGNYAEPGVWSDSFECSLAWARLSGMPLLGIYGNAACPPCVPFKNALDASSFADWASENGVLVAYYFRPNDLSYESSKLTAAGVWFGEVIGSQQYPFVRFCQFDGGVRWLDDSFSMYSTVNNDRRQWNTSKNGEAYMPEFMCRLAEDFADAYFAKWGELPEPVTACSFAFTEADLHRLEADDTTTQISIPLLRNRADGPSSNLVKVLAPSGNVVQTLSVDWGADETQKTVHVDVAQIGFAQVGEVASVVLLSDAGEEIDVRHVVYMDSAVSNANPLWIGERTADTLGWGEWTMDLDVAKAKVAASEGDAYTLVSVEGGLWCPDCANTQHNFFDVSDGNGNRLEQWARAHHVALVKIDIPNFLDDGSWASPTYLRRDPYRTRLALPSSYLADGADASLTNALMRSGLGYLTRKGVSDEDAQAVFERNGMLVALSILEGGFHPSDYARPYRTPVPYMLLYRKDGTFVTDFRDFALDSPGVNANWDELIANFDAMLESAAPD